MKDVAARSMEIFKSGFFCAESVLLAISEWRGVKSDLIPRIATGFCGGISRTSGSCGAYTGGVMALNMMFGRDEPGGSRDRNYAAVARFTREFEKHFGSTNCTELLGCDLSTSEGLETFRSRGLETSFCMKVTGEATAMVARIIEEDEP